MRLFCKSYSTSRIICAFFSLVNLCSTLSALSHIGLLVASVAFVKNTISQRWVLQCLLQLTWIEDPHKHALNFYVAEPSILISQFVHIPVFNVYLRNWEYDSNDSQAEMYLESILPIDRRWHPLCCSSCFAGC